MFGCEVVSSNKRKETVETVKTKLEKNEAVDLIISDLSVKRIFVFKGQVEEKFGEAKRAYGLDRVITKLPHTSESFIALVFLTMNLEKKLRLLLRQLFLRLFGLSFCPQNLCVIQTLLFCCKPYIKNLLSKILLMSVESLKVETEIFLLF